MVWKKRRLLKRVRDARRRRERLYDPRNRDSARSFRGANNASGCESGHLMRQHKGHRGDQRFLRTLATRPSSNPSFRSCRARNPYPNVAMPVFSDDDAVRWGNGRRCNTPSNAPTTRRQPRERTRPQPPAGTPRRLALSCDLGSRRSLSLSLGRMITQNRSLYPSNMSRTCVTKPYLAPRPRLDLPPPCVADFRHGANLFAL